ncbi:fibronectin type III domain-containing protein [Flavobacterium ginsenosidimutans]|uniref:fibronectin type III domain-containing protein n=1 Tax=Flavobacterium ginsenosidimutans TaxID=687844 RepID=UPI003D98572E
MKFKFFFILSLIFAFSGIAQNNSKENNDIEKKNEIQVIARVQKDRILLRWAVNTPIAWKKLNTYGYLIERFTVTRDNKTLTKPERVVLAEAFKPEPVETWEKLIDANDNAAIMAQAIFGESFSVAGGDNLESIVNLSEEAEQRFTFALYTADKDFEIAKKAGLGFEDKNVKQNEKYAYRISSNVPEKELGIVYGGVFVSLKEYEPLPKPMDLTAHFTDNNTMLSWNFKILAHVYGSYYVERSTDKVNYKRITEKPYTSLSQENSNNNRIFYVDSISNNTSYSYRIQGISPFGELGPYSDVVSGKGKSLLKYVPHLTVKEFKDDSTVTLTWEFPEEGNPEISSFELNRSDYDDDKYVKVLKNIPPKDRSVTYNKLAGTNYFTITAIGKNGSSRTSFPMLVQPVDSIPPAKPIGLKATIDSLGVVKLSWTPNKEKDLLGYRIYKGNVAGEEFSQLTVSPHEKNTYEDKVVIKSLNDKVYYKIIAVDYRYNMSPFSETLIVKKPDVIPPTSPIFTKYEIIDGVVNLEWINSQSPDAKSHQLYRKENDQQQWELIWNGTDKIETYQDKKTKEGNTYRYAIFAKDESGLVSNASPEVALLVPNYTVKQAVKGFFAQANINTKSIDLSWNYDENGVESFEIYKATNAEPLQLIQIVKSETRKLSDPTLTINTTYKYGIRALFKDGRTSKMDFYTVKF